MRRRTINVNESSNSIVVSRAILQSHPAPRLIVEGTVLGLSVNNFMRIGT